jgi:hypothetical protein
VDVLYGHSEKIDGVEVDSHAFILGEKPTADRERLVNILDQLIKERRCHGGIVDAATKAGFQNPRLSYRRPVETRPDRYLPTICVSGEAAELSWGGT